MECQPRGIPDFPRASDRALDCADGVDGSSTSVGRCNVRTDKGGGFFIEPTCFVDVGNKMRIAQEEIFGSVLVVIPFGDDDDAVFAIDVITQL